MKFPIYKPSLTGREKELVVDCMDSTWISSRGKYVDEFEKQLAQRAGVASAIAMHNGTHPLHIACLLSGVTAESEVIVPVFTYVATANAVLYCNATPVFVDISPADWNIDTKQVAEKLTEKTQAIIPVDIYGYPAGYRELRELIGDQEISLISDAAESFGASYFGQMSGSLGDFNTFSFFGNKTITTGEGGALLLNSEEMAEKAHQLKNQGNSFTQRYFHDVLGYNYRMTNLQAAIGVAQLERADEILKRKREIYNRYKTNLETYVTFQEPVEGIDPSYWLVSFCLPAHCNKDNFSTKLQEAGIETRPFFVPMDELPYFESGDFPVAREISIRGVSVPSYPDLTDEDIDHISDRIIDAIKEY